MTDLTWTTDNLFRGTARNSVVFSADLFFLSFFSSVCCCQYELLYVLFRYFSILISFNVLVHQVSGRFCRKRAMEKKYFEWSIKTNYMHFWCIRLYIYYLYYSRTFYKVLNKVNFKARIYWIVVKSFEISVYCHQERNLNHLSSY